jgi:hypothetical protein
MIINCIINKIYTIARLFIFIILVFIAYDTMPQAIRTYNLRIAEPADTAVTLVYNDTLILPSFKEFDLNVKMKPACEIAAVSIGIFFPEEYLEIIDVVLKDVPHGYTWKVNDSLMLLAWSNIAPIFINEKDTILVLKMRTLDISGLVGTIRLSIIENTEFADPTANVIKNVVLEIPEIKYLRPDTIDTVTGYYARVYPNPFRTNTILYFGLKEESKVKISIVNADGMLIMDKGEKSYPEGEYQMKLDSLDLAAGVFFLKFEIRNSEGKKEELFKIMSTR